MSDATGLTFSSVNDLVQKAKINFTGKEPRSVYQRLPAMREKSDLAKKQGDDETAYIMLKRWLDSVEWLRRTHNKDGRSAYAANMTVEQVRSDVSKVTSLTYRCMDGGIYECLYFR